MILALLAATVAAAGAESILPTAIGTSWEYSVRGAKPEDARVSTVLVRISGAEHREGRELLRFETLIDGALLKTESMSVEAGGLLCHQRTWADGRKVEFSPPQTLIAAPLKVGASWQAEDGLAEESQLRRFQIVAQERATLPEGTFPAWRIESAQDWPVASALQRWFVAGIGIVKEVETTRGPGGRLLQRVTTALRKYSPATPESAATFANERPSLEIAVQNESSPAPPQSRAEVQLELASTREGPAAMEFRSDVPHIFLRWRGRHLPVDSTVRIAWIAEDVGDLAPPNFVVDQVERTVESPDFAGRFTLSRPEDGWATGKYRAELYLDGELRASMPVTIRD